LNILPYCSGAPRDQNKRGHWRSKGGASGGTRPDTQALGAHQHTFCSHLKTHFKQKFRPKKYEIAGLEAWGEWGLEIQ